MEKLPEGLYPYRKSTEVEYVNTATGLELKMNYDNTKIIVVPDRFELSNVCYYDRDSEDDPIMFFDPKLMQELAGHGFQAIVADHRAIEAIEQTYAKVEAEKIDEEFQQWSVNR